MAVLAGTLGRAGYDLGGISNGHGSLGFGPFDPMILQAKYIDGGETPNRVITIAGLEASNKIGPVDNSVYLYDMVCSFETPALGVKAQNLHRNGATRATPVWCVMPKSSLSVKTFQKLFENSIATITITTLAYIGSAGMPVITETITFKDCFVISMEPFSNGYFTPFSFTFVTVTWKQIDYSQESPNGATPTGTYEYTFNYGSAIGSNAS